jgi:hypothetical protein
MRWNLWRRPLEATVVEMEAMMVDIEMTKVETEATTVERGGGAHGLW